MRIKFKAPDPRAGSIAQMDSHRGQELVDAGAAVQIKDDESETPAPTSAAPVSAPATKAAAKSTGKRR